MTQAQFEATPGFAGAAETAEFNLSSTQVPETIIAHISGLAPDTTYRFRVVAENELGEGVTPEPAPAFTTFATPPAAGLPDERRYEMVSPPQKAGEVIPPEPETQLGGSCAFCLPGANDQVMPMQSAPSGDSVLYLGQPFSGGLASGLNEYVAPRTSSGWGTQSLSSPVTTGVYEAFSADLTHAVFSQGQPALSPQAPSWEGQAFQNLYRRENGPLQPLITKEPPNRNPVDFKVRFAGANAGTAFEPAFGHVVFAADDALTEATSVAPAAPEVGASGDCTVPGTNCNIYEWAEAELRLINVLPDESAASNAVIGSGQLLGQLQIPNVSNAISDDGSRIFWSAGESGQIYVRVDGEETLEIPGPGNCKASVLEATRVCFLTASDDGTSVLLSNGQIYELNGAGNAYVASTDLTGGKGGFQGILGAAEDLSRVYFVDTKALTLESVENANGEHAEAGEFNLYGFDEGELNFIGILLPGDNGFGVASRFGAWRASAQHRTAQVSADGRWVAFMSLAPLTGYDNTLSGGGNCKKSPGPACREVFVYSADSGELSCASCNPSGQRPVGPSNLSLLKPLPSSPPFRQPGNLSLDGEGRLFFETLDALSPRDTNGQIQDVYEWEPNGVGSCKRADGCIYLISSGNSPNDSMFLDSSASGNDVFFITRAQLLPRDKDQQLDLYDARVGGGVEEATKPPCEGETCKGPLSSPPTQPTPGSSGFTGSGNPPKPKTKPCKRGFVKKKGKCVKKKPKKQQKRNQGGSK